MSSKITGSWGMLCLYASDSLLENLTVEQVDVITKSMKHYAKQFIDLAINECDDSDTKDDLKQSILKIKNLIK